MPKKSRQGLRSKDVVAVSLLPSSGVPVKQRRWRLAPDLAKQHSNIIDEQIRENSDILQVRKAPHKLLLLGQAESGKTELLKQFLCLRSRVQSNLYRASIYLNVLNSVQQILDAIAASDNNDPAFHELCPPPHQFTLHQNYPPHIAVLATHLQPLLDCRKVLEQQLQRLTSASTSHPSLQTDNSIGDITMDWTSPNDPGRLFVSCADVLVALWDDLIVQDVLAKQCPSIRESPAFFMDDLARVTSRGYLPSLNDIFRLQSGPQGIREYPFWLSNVGWRIFDVRIPRTQRLRWAAYFQDAKAIIFLAPVSPFNQTLAEDPRMNRVKDSLLLWQEICRNGLLRDVSLMLFLNKCNLLKAKLEAGVQFQKYMTAYEGPNEWKPVVEFLRGKFEEVYKANYKPGKRMLYVHQTPDIDLRVAHKIVANVREQIMKESLNGVGLFSLDNVALSE